MLFAIKEAFWSLGKDFSIKDQNEQPVYRVQGSAFSWNNKLSFEDMRGKQLAQINQKLLSFKPRYEIHIKGKKFAEIIKEWSWLDQKFTLDIPGPNDYTITGSFWQHEFNFERGGKVVATVSKKYLSWTDTYGVEIEEGEDVVAILCTCIVIDQVLHDDSSGAAGIG